MKIRSGFVSNSSSSSFTCDVCGETQSGMDMCRRDAGMQECQNGHTFCDSHELDSSEPTIDEKREALIKAVNSRSYLSAEDKAKRTEEYQTSDEGTIEDEYSDMVADRGCDAAKCPCCNLDTLDGGDIINYALIQLGFKTRKELAAHVKEKFGTYDNFQKYLKN